MISSSLSYLFIILLFTSVSLVLVKQNFKVLNYLPPIVLLYLSLMFISSFALFEKSEAITSTYTTLKNNLLPAMLFLMLLPNNISELIKIGPKMLISFFLATFSLFIAFVLSFFIFMLPESDIYIFGPLAGSWMGGTANMLAVASSIQSSESFMGITLLIDAFDYSLWLMFLLILVPFAKPFNNFIGVKDSCKNVDISQSCALRFSIKAYVLLIVSALGVSLFSQVFAIYLAEHFFGSVTTWSVVLASLLGVFFSFSPLAKIKGLQGTSNAMLYLLIALIASRADIDFNLSLLFYLFIGLFILLSHALLMLIFAKIFKLDLFSISVASLANIGGIASAPILCAAYSQKLVGVGVLMASMGYIIGTFVALVLVEVLRCIT